MALEESKRGGSSSSHKVNDGQKMIPSTSLSQSVVDDLLSMGLGDVFNNPQTQDQLPSTSQSLANNDPWSPQPSSSNGIKSNGK
jgi:hypothetical protein